MTDAPETVLKEDAWDALTRTPLKVQKQLEALTAERDEWKAAFGHFLNTVPLPDVLKMAGSVQDAIDYFNNLHAERDAMRGALTEIVGLNMGQHLSYRHIFEEARRIAEQALPTPPEKEKL